MIAEAIRTFVGASRDARCRTAGKPESPHSTCIGAHKVDFERHGVDSSLVDLDVVFLGTSGSMPTAGARSRRRSCGVAASGSSSTARRDAAPAPAQRRRPRRPRGDLPHPLPRGPLPRPAGHAQDLRAARSRRPARDLRAAGARRPHGDAPPCVRTPHVSREHRRALAGQPARARRLPDRGVCGRARRLRDRLRPRRVGPAGSLRRGRGGQARCPARARARRVAAR
jgi:hypothetical protein